MTTPDRPRNHEIDIDDLERKTREVQRLKLLHEASPTHMTNQYDYAMAAWDHHVVATPDLVLALIARIRELEIALSSAADDRDRIIGVLGAVTVGDILGKGVVLR